MSTVPRVQGEIARAIQDKTASRAERLKRVDTNLGTEKELAKAIYLAEKLSELNTKKCFQALELSATEERLAQNLREAREELDGLEKTLREVQRRHDMYASAKNAVLTIQLYKKLEEMEELGTEENMSEQNNESEKVV